MLEKNSVTYSEIHACQIMECMLSLVLSKRIELEGQRGESEVRSQRTWMGEGLCGWVNGRSTISLTVGEQ